MDLLWRRFDGSGVAVVNCVRLSRTGFLVGLVSWLVGCASGVGVFAPRFETARDLPGGSRQPDGVAIDRDTAVSSARLVGSTTDGLVALEEPLDFSEAMQIIRVFFRAVGAEDMEMMSTVLADEAEQVDTDGSSRIRMVLHWTRRFERFDYRGFAVELPYRESMVETYGYEDLAQQLPKRPSRPADMDPDGLLIRVPMMRTSVGYDRVFGEEILFVVRSNQRRIRIHAAYEGFRIP